MVNNYIENLKQFILNPSFYRKSLDDMARVLQHLKDSFKNDNKIVVIFLVNFVPSWGKMASLYEELKTNPLFDPIIVCVPFFYRISEINTYQKNEVYDYFVNNGYDAVNAINSKGEWVNLKEFKPYFVFCSRMYNNNLPMCYRSGRISKYSLLCVIPYGITISSSMAKSVINHGFCKNVFCYFSFDDTEKEIFINKFKLGMGRKIQNCENLGKVSLEHILNMKKKRKKTKRKVIWAPRWTVDGGSNFLNYKDVIFSLANDYKDIDFIIRPHPLMFKNFINSGFMTQKEVSAFKKRCSNLLNVTLDEKKEYIDTFWESDLLISDFSSILIEYLVTEKPIIYCLHSTKFEYTETGEKLLSSIYLVNNAKELIKQFENWYSNLDEKANNRLELLKELEIEGCSKKISNKLIDFLKE